MAAYVYLGVFVFLLINLLAAIILTIVTHPGSIPQDREWDINEEAIG